jgi:hypothetical protein
VTGEGNSLKAFGKEFDVNDPKNLPLYMLTGHLVGSKLGLGLFFGQWILLGLPWLIYLPIYLLLTLFFADGSFIVGATQGLFALFAFIGMLIPIAIDIYLRIKKADADIPLSKRLFGLGYGGDLFFVPFWLFEFVLFGGAIVRLILTN